MSKDGKPGRKQEPQALQQPPAAPVIELLDPELRRIAKIIGIMIIIAGGLTALVLAWPFIEMVIVTALPFLVALILAYIFHPVVTFFQERLRLTRVGGVLFLYAVFLVVLAAFFAMVLPILITQIGNAYEGIRDFVVQSFEKHPEYKAPLTSMQEWLVSNQILPEDLKLTTLLREAAQSGNMRAAATAPLKAVGGVLSFLYDLVIGTVGFVIALTFVVLVNIYLLIDFSKLRRMMEVMIPEKRQTRVFDVLAKTDEAVGGFIRGILITAFLVGLMTFLGLLALGLNQYALLIGVIAGLGNLVPYMGPIAGGAPALLYVIFSGNYEGKERIIFALLVVALIVVIQVIEGFVLQPKVVGQNAQLHPIAVLFALALGANFGILGMIVAVPLACIARVLIKEFYWDRRQVAWERRTGEKFSSRPRRVRA